MAKLEKKREERSSQVDTFRPQDRSNFSVLHSQHKVQREGKIRRVAKSDIKVTGEAFTLNFIFVVETSTSVNAPSRLSR